MSRNGHRRTSEKSPRSSAPAQAVSESPHHSLIRLRARPDSTHVTHGRTALITNHDGFIAAGDKHGLFSYETRFISQYEWLVNGSKPQRVIGSCIRQNTWMGYFICPPPGGKGDEADPAQHTVEVRLSRYVSGGLHEDVDIENHNQHPVRFRLALLVDADFADQAEVDKGERQQRGKLTRRWQSVGKHGVELRWDYRAQHRYSHQGDTGVAELHRGCVLRIERATSVPSHRGKTISFNVNLRPHGKWHACVSITPVLDGGPLPNQYDCYAFFDADTEWDRKREIYLNESTFFSSPEKNTLSGVVLGALEQSRRDLDSLRLHDLDIDDRAWTVAAGVPTYLALFGRDTLVTSWQAGMLGPELLRGTLKTLIPWQGKTIDDWRDEQPGRMLHEAHTGPLSELNYIPRARYYGAVTPSIYYPVVAASLWHWTGDKQQVLPYVEPALKALRWADKYLDLDDDGIYEYRTCSTQGLKNQGWKDSSDAIVYEDGSQVEDPIATCEMQAFVYASKLHLAGVLWWLGRTDDARALFDQAQELKKRFNDLFWMEDEGFFAMGLDPKKRQIRSIASDPGHCLASGIAETSLAARVADRMMSDELFTGWGIRTLSSRHPAFNPFSYHRGSVWPVENAAFTLAFVRFGMYDKVERLARALFETAALFDYFRLPEVFAGHARDSEHPFPSMYPRSDWPQAWSCSCVYNLLQSLLGLFPYAPMNLLIVNPKMPPWLPEITLHQLRLGKARLTIRFYRNPDGSSNYEILEQHGSAHVLQQPSPWSLTEGWGERVKEALHSLLPGR